MFRRTFILIGILNLFTMIMFLMLPASCGDSGVVSLSAAASWIRTYGGNNSEIITCAVLTSDGGSIVCGYTDVVQPGNNDILAMKLDRNGNVTWTKNLVAGGDDQATAVCQSHDGGFIIAGQTTSFGAAGGHDIFVVHLSSTGATLLSTVYRGPG